MALNKEQKEWIKKIDEDWCELENVPEELVTEEFCIAAVQKRYRALEYVPEELRTEAVCLAAIKNDIEAVPSIPDEILEILKDKHGFRGDINEFLGIEEDDDENDDDDDENDDDSDGGDDDDPAHWLKKIRKDTSEFKNVPQELVTEEFCLAALQQGAPVLVYVPKALKTKALCMAAVKENAIELEYVPETLKTEALCMAAINDRMGGITYALDFIPEAIKTEAFYLAMVKKQGDYALDFVPDELKAKIEAALKSDDGNDDDDDGKDGKVLFSFRVDDGDDGKDQEKALSYAHQAGSHAENGDYSKAIEIWNKAIECAPLDVIRLGEKKYKIKLISDLIASRAIVYKLTKQYDKAIEDYNQAIDHSPGVPSYLESRAGIYMDKGDFTKAIEDYKKVLELDPDDEYAEDKLASCEAALKNGGKLPKPKGVKFPTKTKPKPAPAKETTEGADLSGISFCFTGELESLKRKEAEDRVKAQGGTVKSSVVKDLTYLVTNDTDSGSSKNKKAQEIGVKIIDEKAFLAVLAGKKTAKPAPKGKDEEQAKAYFQQATEFNKNGDLSKAIEFRTKAIEACPLSATNKNGKKYIAGYLFSRAYAYIKLEQFDKAIEDLNKALEHEPDYKEAKDTLARCEEALKAKPATTAKPAPTRAQSAPARNPVCPKCGKVASKPTSKFCAKCGTKLKETCAKCGYELADDTNFCPKCGTKKG
jgi:tetratricopeptide (TPR) repeat protein